MADNEKVKLDDFDEEMATLFSAFDDVRASDELKESTLAAILTQAENETETEQPRVEVKAIEGGRHANKAASHSKARLRVFRMVAIAACLAMALTGGAAYALPASHVKLSQGTEAIDLGVNWFGMTISASAEGDGDDPIQTDGLTSKPYEESVAQALDLLNQRNDNAPIGIDIETNDPGRRQQMEDRGAQIMADRLANQPVENPPADGSQTPDEPSKPQNPAPDGSPDPQQGSMQNPEQQPAGNASPDNPAMNPGELNMAGSPGSPSPEPGQTAPPANP